jgi:hypothetical protein
LFRQRASDIRHLDGLHVDENLADAATSVALDLQRFLDHAFVDKSKFLEDLAK